MVIESFSLGEAPTNVYLIWEKESHQAVVIDPADEADFLADKISRYSLQLKYILATHGHSDHVAAAGELQASFPVPFLIHREDFFLLRQLWHRVKSGKRKTVLLPAKASAIESRSYLLLGKEKIKIILTPGHTPGSICFYLPRDKILFSGDTLFASGRGRTDFPYASTAAIKRSLAKLSQLPPDTAVLPGHEDSSVLKKALATVLF